MAKANKRMISGLIAVIFATGCAHTPPTIPPVAKVDLQRFMGDWYVIANIPSYPEREAYTTAGS
jgi:apolipoprotein D and lipocalin family protein